FAYAVSPSNLLLLLHLLQSLAIGFLIELQALRFQSRCAAVGVLLIMLRGNQLVLAPRKELQKIVQELSGLGQSPIFLELQPPHVAPKQNPVIHRRNGLPVRRSILQDGFTKSVKGADRDALGPFAARLLHAAQHFTRG